MGTQIGIQTHSPVPCVGSCRKIAYLHLRSFLLQQAGSLRPLPYQLRYIQTDRGCKARINDPEITCIYSFFAKSDKHKCLFKYIIRTELYGDCFAIKYYCTRNKHSEHKYSQVLNFFSPIESKRVMEICASVIPIVLEKYPHASFAFNGSRTYDRADYIEGPRRTQRYRIYIELVRRLFGEKIFDISLYDNSSACLFVNRAANPNIGAARTRIYNMFANIYEISI